MGKSTSWRVATRSGASSLAPADALALALVNAVADEVNRALEESGQVAPTPTSTPTPTATATATP